ncbi:MAG: hypothetical protein ABIT38_01085 [Gemmatimonadaceae bacterium]
MPTKAVYARTALAVAILFTGTACREITEVSAESERPSPALYASLDTLLMSERRADSRYGQVLRRFGSVDPFTRLAAGQSQRTESLERIYLSYGEALPANPYAGMAQPYVAYRTVDDACAETLSETQELVALYDRALRLKLPSSVARAWTQNRLRAKTETIPAAKSCR